MSNVDVDACGLAAYRRQILLSLSVVSRALTAVCLTMLAAVVRSNHRTSAEPVFELPPDCAVSNFKSF